MLNVLLSAFVTVKLNWVVFYHLSNLSLLGIFTSTYGLSTFNEISKEAAGGGLQVTVIFKDDLSS
jgi:hypothetical protein